MAGRRRHLRELRAAVDLLLQPRALARAERRLPEAEERSRVVHARNVARRARSVNPPIALRPLQTARALARWCTVKLEPSSSSDSSPDETVFALGSSANFSRRAQAPSFEPPADEVTARSRHRRRGADLRVVLLDEDYAVAVNTGRAHAVGLGQQAVEALAEVDAVLRHKDASYGYREHAPSTRPPAPKAARSPTNPEPQLELRRRGQCGGPRSHARGRLPRR